MAGRLTRLAGSGMAGALAWGTAACLSLSGLTSTWVGATELTVSLSLCDLW